MNFQRAPLNMRILQKYAKEMGCTVDTIVYYSEIRWLSAGESLDRLVILWPCILKTLEQRAKEGVKTAIALLPLMKDPEFIFKLWFLRDYTAKVNIFFQQLQVPLIKFDAVS